MQPFLQSDSGFVFTMVFIVLAIVLLPAIFFTLTLQNTLKAISRENRTMPPANVWLIFIPLFGVVWQFVIVNNVAESIQREFIAKDMVLPENKPTHSIGLAMCILNCCAIIPLLGSLAAIAGIICWIIYWVKVTDYKNQILQMKEYPAVN